MYPGAELQHPYINFGPMQDHEEEEKETMPPALPPKRSSRSHPGSFRSEGILASYLRDYQLMQRTSFEFDHKHFIGALNGMMVWGVT